MNGFIKLHRKLKEWEWYTDNNVKSLFLHCLLSANFKEKKWQGKTIKRGQFITSLNHLSIETGLSDRNIRTAFDKLEKTGEILKEATKKFTLITVCNFDSYQSFEELDRQTSDTVSTHDRQTSDTQPTTTEEGKEYKNEKKEENKLTLSNAQDSNLIDVKNKEKKSLPKSSAKKVSQDVPPTEEELETELDYKPFYFDFLKDYKFNGWSKQLIHNFYLYCEAREKKEKEKNPRYSFNESGIKDTIRQISASMVDYGMNITEIAVQEATPTPWVNLQPLKVKNRLERERIQKLKDEKQQAANNGKGILENYADSLQEDEHENGDRAEDDSWADAEHEEGFTEWESVND